MDDPNEEYRARIMKAVVYAIARNSAVDIGDGKKGCEINSVLVSAVLTDLVAQFLAAKAADLGETTRRDVRELGEAYGKVLRTRVQQILDSGKLCPSFWEADDTDTLKGPVDPSLN